MERYYTHRGSAQRTVPGIPLASLFVSQAPLDASNKPYNLTLQSTSSFTLRATPINTQQSNGYLELLSTGARHWDRNNNGNIEADELCWEGRCN